MGTREGVTQGDVARAVDAIGPRRPTLGDGAVELDRLAHPGCETATTSQSAPDQRRSVTKRLSERDNVTWRRPPTAAM